MRAGKMVSRNFYWVPGTLTTFDWPKTDYTHTPAARHEDLTALANSAAGQNGCARGDARRLREGGSCAWSSRIRLPHWRFR